MKEFVVVFIASTTLEKVPGPRFQNRDRLAWYYERRPQHEPKATLRIVKFSDRKICCEESRCAFPITDLA